jgi:serine/threonine protein kinase
MIANRYKIHEKIGEGCFGKIHKGTNVRTGERVAIKMESRNNAYQLLKNESKILQYLKKIPGIPEMKWFCVDTDYNYLVMTLLGESLLDLIHSKRVFFMKWINEIGIQIVNILRDIHNEGIIHRDIKPDNFLFGLDTSTKNEKPRLYLIDFGFSKSFLDGNKKHIEMKKKTKITGTLNYVSIHVHDYYESSRRDDIESFVYMIVFFYYGFLFWMNEADEAKIKEAKKNLKNHPSLPNHMREMIEYVQTLEFHEEPNYEYLIELLQRQERK